VIANVINLAHGFGLRSFIKVSSCHISNNSTLSYIKQTMSQPGDYEAVKKDILEVIPSGHYDDGTYGPNM
jgi:hypothetical protein